MFNQYFHVFITVIISTIGAFVPMFLLLYIHFFIRKRFFKNIRPSIVKSLNRHKKNKRELEEQLSQFHQFCGVSNSFDLLCIDCKDLIKNLLGGGVKTSKDFNCEDFRKSVFNVFSKAERYIKDDKTSIIKYKGELNYINSYNFKRYLVGLLNDKFPDQYFRPKDK